MVDFTPVSITKNAAEEIKAILQKKRIPQDYGLRIGIRGAGCAGINYMLGFDKKKSQDLEYFVDTIPVYVDKKHVMHLVGLKLDFVEDSEQRGFSFEATNK